MAAFKYERDTAQDAIRTKDLSPHDQLRRAFPLWAKGAISNAKNVGSVVAAMIETEEVHTLPPAFVWKRRLALAEHDGIDANFVISSEMCQDLGPELFERYGGKERVTPQDAYLRAEVVLSAEDKAWLMGWHSRDQAIGGAS